jgi:DNA-binding SARP family transcriptional activator/tetratricopeptide (TPR) repeat protein
MRLDILGPLVMRSDDGREIPVPRGKPTTLLALLAVRRGRSIGSGPLLDALWGDSPPQSGLKNLHGYVSALRSVLDTATPGGAGRLRFHAGGYQLRMSDDECDLFEFEQLILTGRAAAGAGDDRAAVEALRAALSLWRGNAFPDIGSSGSALLVAEAQLWEEMRITAYEDCIEAELRIDARTNLVPELRRLIVEHPVRERLYLLLMRAMCGVGDLAGALAAYGDARAALVRELGVEPGPALRDLHVRVLRGEPGGINQPTGAREQLTDWPEPRQLPRDIPDFTGRDDVVDRVADLLDDHESMPVVTVTGSPGTGKTALAVRAAHRGAAGFPDGQLYVSLDAGSTRPRQPEQVLGRLLRDLGMPDSAVPVGLAERSAAFRSRLAGRQVLVVLDDAADATQVRDLLPGTPGSAVLVTSRNRLVGLPATGTVQLGALTHDEAVALLATVIGARRVADEPAAAAELVELCGRLPLAVRVLAARLVTRPSWSLRSLLDRLRDQRDQHGLLDELTMGELDVRAGFAVSYKTLGDVDQVAFRRYALAGVPDLPPWAIGALAGPADVDRVLDRLLDSHLLEPFSPGQEHGERYRMHDLVLVFAAEATAAADGDGRSDDPARAALRRLFDRLRGLVEVAYRNLPTPADWLPPVGPAPKADTGSERHEVTDDAMAWCGREVQLIQSVLIRATAAGWHREVLDTVERLAGFLAIQNRMGETERLYSALAAAATDVVVLARAGYGLAQAKMMAGRLTEAADRFADAVDGFATLPEPVGLAHGLVFLSFCHGHRGELDTADELAERALRVARVSGDVRCEIRALRQFGVVRIRQDRMLAAVELLDRALVLAERFGPADLEGIVLNSLANALVGAGDLDRADQICRRAGLLLDRLAQPVARAYIKVTQGQIAELQGRHADAVELVEGARWVFRQLGDRRGEATADYRLGVNELALGQPVRAVPLLRSAVSVFRELALPARAEQAEEALRAASDTYRVD